MSPPADDKRPRRKTPLTMRAAALRVVQQLQSRGFVALFAGGCVRDMLMGRDPHDYDVATSAKPQDVIGLFRRTAHVGAKFGVVLVRIGRHSIEVATFRADGSYSDGRRPDAVTFTTPEEDACRRDFTINGMFFDPVAEAVVDHVGGQADLAAKLIRAIGDPEQRFAEDHLRLLRAVRFAARLGFQIEPETWAAMCRHASDITRVSPERVRMELEEILLHARRTQAVEMLHDAGLLAHLWPGAEVLQANIQRITKALAALPPVAPFELGLAALLLPLSIDEASSACAALRCSNATEETVCWLLTKLPTLAQPAALSLADVKRLMAHAAFDDLLALFAATLAADGRDPAPLAELKARAADIPPEDVAPPPLLTGHDLQQLHLPPGPRYSRILNHVYDAQLNEDIRDRGEAINMARRLADETD